MKPSKDNFSEQSASYKKFRPTYPSVLYEEILSHVNIKDKCWDCGTGNGQVAIALAPYFHQVHATDLSENQLRQAPQLPNISYKAIRAEDTNFPDDYFDLITVAQAIHWFDHAAFEREAKRVLKSGGVLAVWGYGVLRIDEHINPIIDDFYTKVVGKYWDPERKHIDNHYAEIQMYMQEIAVKKTFNISVSWDLSELEGYFNTWSSVRHYRKAHENNPVDGLIKQIRELWRRKNNMQVRFPLFLKMWRAA